LRGQKQDAGQVEAINPHQLQLKYSKQRCDVEGHSRVGVTSRKVVWLFAEQLGFDFVPAFHRLQGRLALCRLVLVLLLLVPVG
jgi:hypothetical protein